MCEKVFVAVYSYEYGEDTRVFSNFEAALAWRDEIAGCYFEQEFPHDKKPETNLGDAYFELQSQIGDESFRIIESQIEEAA